METAMSVSYFVRYQGKPADPQAFLDYYRRTHARFMQAFPGVRGAILHHPVSWHDPVSVKPDLRYMLAQVTFDDATALNVALQSEARLRSREDFKNMPAFLGEVTHQACEAEILF
jgi:uncharacterized protein (TIGR02118 family)